MSLKRKFYTGKDYRKALTIEELHKIARKRIPNFALEYVEGGSEREASLNWNSEALKSIRFMPNILVDTSNRDQHTILFNQQTSSPLIIAPTGLNGMLHHDADKKLARAAAHNNIPFSLSSVSNVRLEDVAEQVGGRLWMQLYLMKDRSIAENIISRADRAGYEALVFTADSNVFGHREWDQRNYRQPGELTLRNLIDVALHPRWVFDVLVPHGVPSFENIVDFMPPEARSASGGVAVFPKLFASNISWQDVKWIRDRWPRKLIIKGILNSADAQRAVEHGCEGIILSNHGGRQLDSCVSPIEVLPAIAEAVGDKITIIIDSGYRRGSDIIKAIALGAHNVMIGRATLYGLAAGGEDGVNHAITVLMTEIDRVLGQLGCRSFDDVGPHLIVRDRSGKGIFL